MAQGSSVPPFAREQLLTLQWLHPLLPETLPMFFTTAHRPSKWLPEAEALTNDEKDARAAYYRCLLVVIVVAGVMAAEVARISIGMVRLACSKQEDRTHTLLPQSESDVEAGRQSPPPKRSHDNPIVSGRCAVLLHVAFQFMSVSIAACAWLSSTMSRRSGMDYEWWVAWLAANLAEEFLQTILRAATAPIKALKWSKFTAHSIIMSVIPGLSDRPDLMFDYAFAFLCLHESLPWLSFSAFAVVLVSYSKIYCKPDLRVDLRSEYLFLMEPEDPGTITIKEVLFKNWKEYDPELIRDFVEQTVVKMARPVKQSIAMWEDLPQAALKAIYLYMRHAGPFMILTTCVSALKVGFLFVAWRACGNAGTVNQLLRKVETIDDDASVSQQAWKNLLRKCKRDAGIFREILSSALDSFDIDEKARVAKSILKGAVLKSSLEASLAHVILEVVMRDDSQVAKLLLHDGSWEVRKAACTALNWLAGRVKEEEAKELLKACCEHDQSKEVRDEAELALRSFDALPVHHMVRKVERCEADDAGAADAWDELSSWHARENIFKEKLAKSASCFNPQEADTFITTLRGFAQSKSPDDASLLHVLYVAFVRQLFTSDAGWRMQACKHLMQLKNDVELETAKELLDPSLAYVNDTPEKNKEVQLMAKEVLQNFQAARVKHLLEKALEHGEEAWTELANNSFSNDSEVLQVLAADVTKDDERNVLSSILLGTEVLSEPHAKFMFQGVIADHRDAVELLLKHQNSDVRKRACHALMWMMENNDKLNVTEEEAKECLNDPDPDVETEARIAYKAFKVTSVTELLRKLVRGVGVGPDDFDAAAAQEAWSQLGSWSKDDEFAELLAQIANELGDQLIDVIRAILRGVVVKDKLHWSVAKTVFPPLIDEHRDVIEHLLADKQWPMRRAACHSLEWMSGKMTTEDAKHLMRHCLKDENSNVTAMANQTIKRLQLYWAGGVAKSGAKKAAGAAFGIAKALMA